MFANVYSRAAVGVKFLRFSIPYPAYLYPPLFRHPVTCESILIPPQSECLKMAKSTCYLLSLRVQDTCDLGLKKFTGCVSKRQCPLQPFSRWITVPRVARLKAAGQIQSMALSRNSKGYCFQKISYYC